MRRNTRITFFLIDKPSYVYIGGWVYQGKLDFSGEEARVKWVLSRLSNNYFHNQLYNILPNTNIATLFDDPTILYIWSSIDTHIATLFNDPAIYIFRLFYTILLSHPPIKRFPH